MSQSEATHLEVALKKRRLVFQSLVDSKKAKVCLGFHQTFFVFLYQAQAVYSLIANCGICFSTLSDPELEEERAPLMIEKPNSS